MCICISTHKSIFPSTSLLLPPVLVAGGAIHLLCWSLSMDFVWWKHTHPFTPSLPNKNPIFFHAFLAYISRLRFDPILNCEERRPLSISSSISRSEAFRSGSCCVASRVGLLVACRCWKGEIFVVGWIEFVIILSFLCEFL